MNERTMNAFRIRKSSESVIVAMKTYQDIVYKSCLSDCGRTEDNLVKAVPLVQDDFIPEGFPNGLF